MSVKSKLRSYLYCLVLKFSKNNFGQYTTYYSINAQTIQEILELEEIIMLLTWHGNSLSLIQNYM